LGSSEDRLGVDVPPVVAGTFYTLLAAAGYAAVSTLTSIALAERVSLASVLLWRYALAAAVLVTFVALRGYPHLPPSEAVAWLVVGGGGQALLVGLALSSLRFIDVATLAFLFYTYPAWVTVVQALRRAERFSARRLVALVLSFGGVVVIAGRPGSGALAWQGIVLALSAAMVYGGYIPTVQRMQKTHSVAVTSAHAKIGSAVCFLLLAAGQGSFAVSMTETAWLAILTLTLFSTVLPGVFFLMGLVRLGAVRTAIVSTVEPFLTALLGAVVLRQALAAGVLLGGAMIVAAVVILQVRRVPREV
jgi:drug/metabolite transporter (DMT)-like permease